MLLAAYSYLGVLDHGTNLNLKIYEKRSVVSVCMRIRPLAWCCSCTLRLKNSAAAFVQFFFLYHNQFMRSSIPVLT